MSERRSFYRKIAYGVAIVVLLFPLAVLSTPATVDDSGGTLARLRTQHGLAQANLGEIDPASETIKLATLGLRGVAVNLLWENANYYKKTKNWTALSATLEQLAKLQPNFISFWKFQAWNLSYNVSVEFDDYRDRYYYVVRGIKFLEKGETYNKFNPHLLWELGWFIGQKIGRSDEYVQYRRLFRADDDYHGDRFGKERDNWLLGKSWYQQAVEAVDDLGRSLGRKSPKVFYSSPAMSQINYAEAIEKEGDFETARREWEQAGQEWFEFGERDIEHSRGFLLRLNDEERLIEQVADLESQMEALAPGLKEELVEEAFAGLSTDQRDVLQRPFASLSNEERTIYYDARRALNITWSDVAARIATDYPDKKNQALQVVTELTRAQNLQRLTKNYKSDSNFDYWRTRCEFEQTEEAVTARRLLYEGRQEYLAGDLVKSKRLFEEGFDEWRIVLDNFPTIVKDHTTGEDLVDYFVEYAEILDRQDLSLLDNEIIDRFPLWDVLNEHDKNGQFTEELQEYRRLHPEFDEETADAADAQNPAIALPDVGSSDADAPADAPAEGGAGEDAAAGDGAAVNDESRDGDSADEDVANADAA